MAYVLVHGGGFAGSCWDRLTPLLDGEVVAVDLPGRGDRPAPLSEVTLEDCVSSVVAEIETRDLTQVLLVGHSLAGLTLSGVLERVPDRIQRAVLVSCAVPPDGSSILDIVDLLAPDIDHAVSRSDGATPHNDGMLDRRSLETIFCNDMDDEQTAFTLSRVVPESVNLISAPVTLGGYRRGVPITYVRLLRDASLPVATQDAMIVNLVGTGSTSAEVPVETMDLDTGHMVMISHPEMLATLLTALEVP